MSSRDAELCSIVKTVARSRLTSQLLEHFDIEVEVSIASDCSAARGMCARTSSGQMRVLSVKELWVPEAFLHRLISVDVSVDTLSDWADTGMEAHTTEPLRLLAMK